MTDLLSTRREVLSLLDDNGIPYELYEHGRAFTIDDCLRMPFLGADVTMCKNILLCNRQKTRFYLMLLKPHTPFRTAVVSKALGVSRLSFAPEDALEGRLHLTSGSVSPLGLWFDKAQEITLCYEPGVRDTPPHRLPPLRQCGDRDFYATGILGEGAAAAGSDACGSGAGDRAVKPIAAQPGDGADGRRQQRHDLLCAAFPPLPARS